MSKQAFGRLLRGAINSIAAYEAKTTLAIEEDLGKQLKVEATTIQRYKTGNIPPDATSVKILAENCVRRGLLGREWLQRFLNAALYPAPDALLDHLCPAIPERPRPQRVYQNLPAPPYAQFVMRTQAYLEVIDGLRQRSAAVLITSLGGMGKTSLAHEVATRCLRDNPDSSLSNPNVDDEDAGAPRFDAVVWVSDKDQPGTTNLSVVFDEIARTLNYPGICQHEQAQKQREIEQLLRQLRVLLVVDNVETITDATLPAWLLRLPEPSKAIITTREYGRAYRRGGWPVELRGMTDAEAWELITERLRGLKIEHLVNNMAQLESLLPATGGNPKAIEIALGLIKYERHPLQQVLDDLYAARSDLFEDLFARAWSMLDEAGQRVLLAATLFADSASSAALSASAGVRGFAFEQALERLTDLALLDVQQKDIHNAPRYGLHPLVRAFGKARLAEQSGFAASARERWSDFFLQFVEQYGDDDLGEAIGYGASGHRICLQAEINNLRTTLAWCFTARPEHAVRIVERITTFLLDEGHWTERLALCSKALEIAYRMELWTSQAGLLARRGWSYLVEGDYIRACQDMEQGIAIARAHGNRQRLVQLLRDRGYLHTKLGEYAQAYQLCAESLELATAIGSEFGILLAHIFHARIVYAGGNYPEAQRLFRKLQGDLERTDHPRDLVYVLRLLGDIAVHERRFDVAEDYFRQAEERLQTLYYEADEAAYLCQNRGLLAEATGDLEAAQTAYEEALQRATRLGIRQMIAEVRTALDRLADQVVSE